MVFVTLPGPAGPDDLGEQLRGFTGRRVEGRFTGGVAEQSC